MSSPELVVVFFLVNFKGHFYRSLQLKKKVLFPPDHFPQRQTLQTNRLLTLKLFDIIVATQTHNVLFCYIG